MARGSEIVSEVIIPLEFEGRTKYVRCLIPDNFLDFSLGENPRAYNIELIQQLTNDHELAAYTLAYLYSLNPGFKRRDFSTQDAITLHLDIQMMSSSLYLFPQGFANDPEGFSIDEKVFNEISTTLLPLLANPQRTPAKEYAAPSASAKTAIALSDYFQWQVEQAEPLQLVTSKYGSSLSIKLPPITNLEQEYSMELIDESTEVEPLLDPATQSLQTHIEELSRIISAYLDKRKQDNQKSSTMRKLFGISKPHMLKNKKVIAKILLGREESSKVEVNNLQNAESFEQLQEWISATMQYMESRHMRYSYRLLALGESKLYRALRKSKKAIEETLKKHPDYHDAHREVDTHRAVRGTIGTVSYLRQRKREKQRLRENYQAHALYKAEKKWESIIENASQPAYNEQPYVKLTRIKGEHRLAITAVAQQNKILSNGIKKVRQEINKTAKSLVKAREKLEKQKSARKKSLAELNSLHSIAKNLGSSTTSTPDKQPATQRRDSIHSARKQKAEELPELVQAFSLARQTIPEGITSLQANINNDIQNFQGVLDRLMKIKQGVIMTYSQTNSPHWKSREAKLLALIDKRIESVSASLNQLNVIASPTVEELKQQIKTVQEALEHKRADYAKANQELSDLSQQLEATTTQANKLARSKYDADNAVSDIYNHFQRLMVNLQQEFIAETPSWNEILQTGTAQFPIGARFVDPSNPDNTFEASKLKVYKLLTLSTLDFTQPPFDKLPQKVGQLKQGANGFQYLVAFAQQCRDGIKQYPALQFLIDIRINQLCEEFTQALSSDQQATFSRPSFHTIAKNHLMMLQVLDFAREEKSEQVQNLIRAYNDYIKKLSIGNYSPITVMDSRHKTSAVPPSKLLGSVCSIEASTPVTGISRHKPNKPSSH